MGGPVDLRKGPVADFVSDTVGLVLVAGMLVAAIGAPVLVILLAALLLPFEIALVLVLAAALLLARLAGAKGVPVRFSLSG